MRITLDLQHRIWRYSEIDIVPSRMFIVARESGGQVLAAFHDDKAIGFALAYVGVRQGMVYLHSHMVGVVPEYQNRGIGRVLKLAQRTEALARGITLIEWTFDPLQLKNARFNLETLGAIARRYISDCYGQTSSPLHAGLPTDRLVAEWWLASDRVRSLLRGQEFTARPNAARICIPRETPELRGRDAAAAERIQNRVREQFEKRIATGFAAVGFELDDSHGSYILEPYAN
jgi:predicted GNAT superfamily acetyltransferase